MKKRWGLLVLCFCLIACLFSCNQQVEEKPLSKNQPYFFEKSVCTVDDGITMQELYGFIPQYLWGEAYPTTVEAFETMVVEHIDRFTIRYTSEEGTEEMYFLNVFDSIEITDTVCKFIGEESAELPYVQDGNTYSVTAEGTTILLTYENNRLSYTIEAPEYFAVTHYFGVEK